MLEMPLLAAGDRPHRAAIYYLLLPFAAGFFSYRIAGRLLDWEPVQEKIDQFTISTKTKLQVLIGPILFYLILVAIYMAGVRPFGHLLSQDDRHTVWAWCLVPSVTVFLIWCVAVWTLRKYRPERCPADQKDASR